MWNFKNSHISEINWEKIERTRTTFHYLDLAHEISADYGYDIHDVLDDLCAVISRLKLDPKELDIEKVD